MKKKARSYSVDFKQEAVRRMAHATTIIRLAKELGVRQKLLYPLMVTLFTPFLTTNLDGE